MANSNADAILQAALELSDTDRAALVARLVASLPEQAVECFEDVEFQHEMERRFADSADSIPWSQVRDEL
jgi:hypothetical protein